MATRRDAARGASTAWGFGADSRGCVDIGFTFAALGWAEDIMDLRSKRAGEVAPPQPGAQPDGRQVEDRDDGDEQQRGGEDHRAGGLTVRTLESHVVYVK